jgi:hypothetical protein
MPVVFGAEQKSVARKTYAARRSRRRRAAVGYFEGQMPLFAAKVRAGFTPALRAAQVTLNSWSDD